MKLNNLLLSFVVLNLLGTAHSAAGNKPEPLPSKLIRVPMTRQATDYTCGAAALQSVIGYYGENIRESELAKELHTNTVNGTPYRQILAFAKRHHYEAKVFKNASIESLEKMLDAGTPVICLIQAWPERKVDYAKDWDDGHYVVAVGHDDVNIYFMDPCTLGKYTYIPRKEFLQRWHDTDGKERLTHFAMTLTKPKAKLYDPNTIEKLE